MSNHSTAKEIKAPDTPVELNSLLALNVALAAARASETDKQYIEAAMQVKKLADFK